MEINSLVYGSDFGDDVTAVGAYDSLIGGAGSDRLTLNGEASYASGGLGDDGITSTGAGAYLSGAAGNDYIRAQNSAVVMAGAGDDRVWAEGNSQVLLGAGADTLTATLTDFSAQDQGALTVLDYTLGEDALVLEGFGAEAITLETMQDWKTIFAQSTDTAERFFEVTETADGVLIAAIDRGESGAHAKILLEGATYADLAGETILGTTGRDRLDLDQDGAMVNALDGAAVVVARGDAMVVDGGAGADRLTAVGANDTLLGGEGADRLTLGALSGAAEGGADADYIQASLGKTASHLVTGGAGAELFRAQAMGLNTQSASLTITDFNPEEDLLEIVTAGNKLLSFRLDAIPEGLLAEQEGEDLVIRVAGDKADDQVILKGVSLPKPPADIIGTEGADSYVTLNDDQSIDMRGGDDTVKGSHEIDLGAGDDRLTLYLNRNASHDLTGGAGADRFDLLAGGSGKFGQVVIRDFDLAEDQLLVNGAALDLTAEGVSLADNDAGDAVLSWGEDRVTLQGVKTADFAPEPVPFVASVVVLADGFEMPAVAVEEEAEEPAESLELI